MNKTILIIMIVIIFGCTKSNVIQYEEPKKIIITGVVINSNPLQNEIAFDIEKLGTPRESLITELDSIGNFSISFETYFPSDFWISYKTSFMVLTHPGDSIHVIFDGGKENRTDVLKTVQFSGDATKINQDAVIFQEMYYSSELYKNIESKLKAQSNYKYQEYLKFLDKNKTINEQLFNTFVKEVHPDEETKIWAKTFLEADYYTDLASYAYVNNNLSPNKQDIPLSYYENFKNFLPIKKEMLISSYAVSSYVNGFLAIYVHERLLKDKVNAKYVKNGKLNTTEEGTKILQIRGILEYIEDDLLKQMVLTELFSQSLETNKTELVEKNSDIIYKNVKETFLLEPLLKKYNKVKDWKLNPEIASNAVLKKVANTSANEIMDEIIEINKGKVIYIDCWGTWCGACIAEFPKSKKLMMEMKDKNVAFVYLCFNSEETGWKAIISEHQLEGQQYLLTPKQSLELSNALEIQAFPSYVLINQNGVIADEGNHLYPSKAKDKIYELLKN